jgi:hypothetical protein
MNYATQKLNGMSGCRVTVFPGRWLIRWNRKTHS